MLHHNSVFHSLLKHVPWSELEQIVEKYGADKLARELKTKRHLIALLYGQFSGATSLREIVTGLESHETRLYHLGAAAVKRSTVSDANSQRPWQVFAELATTYVFDLGFYDYGWWAQLDDAGCRFVTRLKKNTLLQVVYENRVRKSGNILSDRIGYLPQRLANSRKNPLQVPVRELRVIIDTGKILRIVTNDIDAPAEEIADLYKQRWQIELFFRWVKQTLRIRHFIGLSENAVRIQIAVALIAFVILRLAQAAQKAVHSPLQFARLVRANLMHRRPIDRMLGPLQPHPTNSDQLKLALYFT